MKKLYLFIAACLVSLASIVLVGCDRNEKQDKIVVAEVTHSVFYAPQYIALSEGIFEKNGLNVEIILTSGADKVMAALLSKEAQIGLMGPEASIYVYVQGKTDYAMTFAQLTQKDGAFIVARKDIPNFTLNDLVGRSILGGRKGGMPEMTLEYILNKNNLKPKQNDPNANINIRTDVAFAAMAGAFIQGEGDFTTLFEPTATEVALQNKGYVVSSVGQWTDNVAYTCYSALNSFIEDNDEKVIAFTKSIAEAQKWVQEHSDLEVATSIHQYFSETDIEILTSAIGRYRKIDAWSHDPYLDEAEFKHLMDIIIAAGELKEYVPFEKLVVNKYQK